MTQVASGPDIYYVAMKAFVRMGSEVLILTNREVGKGDLVGGRIDVGEFDIPFEEILERELKEELGPDFTYRVNGPAAIFRYRREQKAIAEKPVENPILQVLMIGFEVEYLEGEIRLSEEHTDYEWMPLEQALERLPGGQKIGMQKYMAYLADPEHKIQY